MSAPSPKVFGAGAAVRAAAAWHCGDLADSLAGVTAVIVASADGLLIHSSWTEVEGMRAAAISAAALGLGDRIAQDFGDGEFEDLVVAAGDQIIGIYAIGDGHVLGVVAQAEQVSLSLLHEYARITAATLESDLNGGIE